MEIRGENTGGRAKRAERHRRNNGRARESRREERGASPQTDVSTQRRGVHRPTRTTGTGSHQHRPPPSSPQKKRAAGTIANAPAAPHVPVGKDLWDFDPLLVALAVGIRPALVRVALWAVDNPMVPARPPERIALVHPRVEAVAEGHQRQPQEAAYAQAGSTSSWRSGTVQRRRMRRTERVRPSSRGRRQQHQVEKRGEREKPSG